MFGNYAEINPTLNYHRGVIKNLESGYNDMPNFQLTQQTKGYPLDQRKKNLINVPNDNYYCGGESSLALRGLQMNNTPLSVMYFSGENIARLQKQLRRVIYNMSDNKFRLDEDQNEEDLLIAMRAVFLDNAKHLPTEIVRQVKELNAITIDYIAPDMLTNIKQQYNYLRDISQPLQMMDHPLNVNRAGRKTLPSYTSVWGAMPVKNSF
jgi:hypothetical protein